MSYAAKGEKVFAYQDPTYPDCTPQSYRRSDHRLKRLLSTPDRRAWDFCEEVRYEHLYDLMSGSRTCLGIDHCHKYVPLEDLLSILTSDKDDLIRRLQDRLRHVEGEGSLLQGRVAAMTEEVNRSRDMLRQAMHKLENIDEIVNENKKLQCRLRCSEERVRYLEEKKKKLESELADLRSRSQIQMDLEKAKEMLCEVTQRREESTGMEGVMLQGLSAERNELQEKVRELENELKEAKKKEAEIEMLKKRSQSDSLDREEMCKENECYRRKLASMKCLEKQILELKKQGRALADKYKRESLRAAEQVNKMCQAAKELQCLREERDSLRKRVNELASYECQYNKLQRKLQCVDAVIAENENLNSKLVALQKLEKENEYLRCRLEGIQEVENSAAEDKEKIMQLQCAVADQEEEMKDLLCQIERLTSGKHEEELERLRCQLYEKNCKLKLCEEQLAEVPMLEAEIDELRRKLQCCCREFPEVKRGESSWQKVEVRFPASSTGIRANYKCPGQKSSSVIGIRREEKARSCQEVRKAASECGEKEVMSCEEVQSLLRSSKGIISCVLEDMIEHQKEMEELEMCNRAMKEEIEALKAKVGGSEKECLVQELSGVKRALEEKSAEVCRLRERVGELERRAEGEGRGRGQAEEGAGGAGGAEERAGEGGAEGAGAGAGKVTPEDPEFDCCGSLQKEIEDLKQQIGALNTLTEELKKENELLRELQQPCPDFSKELDEKCALENLLSLLQAELDAFKGQKLSDECEALRNELKRVLEQNCQLKALVDCYRQRLELEKQSGELLQGKERLGGGPVEVEKSPSELKRLQDAAAQAEAEAQARARAKAQAEEAEVPMGMGKSEVEKSPSELKRLKDAAAQAEAEAQARAKGQADAERQAKEKADAERQAKEKADAERQAKEKADAERQAKEKADAERQAKEKADAERQAKEKGDAERLAKEKADAERQAKEKADAERLAKEKADAERLAKEKVLAKPQDAGPGKYPKVTPSGRVFKSPSEEVQGLKQAEAAMKERASKCEEELKALRSNLAQVQKENEELKNSLKEAEKKVSAAEAKAAGAAGAATVAKPPPAAPEPKAAGGGPEAAALQERIKQLEAENADKVKKLMEQHQKELAEREKKCNDNLNAMKAGYETDIRKLTERHKASMMRLQGLHEDEVHELNTNYETQLETMQTQSEEAMSDVAKGSAARLRRLAEKHAAEMKQMEEKLGATEGHLTQSQEELRRAREHAEGIAAQLQARFSRDMQKLKRGSSQKLNSIKGAYEEELKKREAEMESLRQKMKELEASGGVCDCKSAKKKPQKPRDPTCPLDFDDVLQKILEQGLESLTFNEIALVHRKTCCALEGIMMGSRICPTLEPPVGDGCPHTPLLEADKQQLLNRIFALENDIQQKQKQTQEAIISMEVAIKKERCRLQEVKNSLQSEQQKNSELKLLLSSQTKLEMDLKKERDRLGNQASFHQSLCEQKSRQLDEEIRSKKCLEEEVEKLKGKLKQLCTSLSADRGGSDCKQTNQVEVMRVKLEQALNQERRLALQLENEAKYRMQLQCQLQALRQSFRQMVNLPAVDSERKVSQSPLEAKTAKDRQNLDQIKEKKNKIKTKLVKKHRK